MVYVLISPVCHVRCNGIDGIEIQDAPVFNVSLCLLFALLCQAKYLLLNAIVNSAVTVECSNFGFLLAHLARLLIVVRCCCCCSCRFLVLIWPYTTLLEIGIQGFNFFVDQCRVMVTGSGVGHRRRVRELLHTCVCGFPFLCSVARLGLLSWFLFQGLRLRRWR